MSEIIRDRNQKIGATLSNDPLWTYSPIKPLSQIGSFAENSNANRKVEPEGPLASRMKAAFISLSFPLREGPLR